MRLSRTLRARVSWSVVLLAAAAWPAAAGEEVIAGGADLWTTAGGGMTFSAFSSDPLPADFFCPGSEPFLGRIGFRGEPLATEPAGGLGASDTIVRRLDDARFDGSGVARTRIQLMALSLVGTEPIETSCGRYEVAVSLAGEQPTTEMKIRRTSPHGGTYEAPLALNVKLVFLPVAGNPHPRRELVRRVDLGPGSRSVWSYVASEPRGQIRVDTDGDRIVEAVLPGGSNFRAGIELASGDNPPPWFVSSDGVCGCVDHHVYYTSESCHCNPNDSEWNPDLSGDGCADIHRHCVYVCLLDPSLGCDVADPIGPIGP
jgi:hypothetical protein